MSTIDPASLQKGVSILRRTLLFAPTRLRDGIHGFVAGRKKVRIVDFTVSLSDSEAFSYVQVETKPRDAEARCYDAVWTGK